MEPSKRKVVELMPILQTTDLKKYYGEKPNITKALDGVSLSVEHGEFVAIVGTSGSGKSTLLNERRAAYYFPQTENRLYLSELQSCPCPQCL